MWYFGRLKSGLPRVLPVNVDAISACRGDHVGHILGERLARLVIQRSDGEANRVSPAANRNLDLGLLWELGPDLVNGCKQRPVRPSGLVKDPGAHKSHCDVGDVLQLAYWRGNWMLAVSETRGEPHGFMRHGQGRREF